MRMLRTVVATTRQGLFRALLISLAALAVPVAGTFLIPEQRSDYEALLWLLALVPAFLLAYHRGWKGVATSLAFGMALLSVTYAVAQTVGRQVPDLLFAVVTLYLVFALMVGWLVERLQREVKPEQPGGEAFTDATTGLPNRKHAELHLEIEFNAAQRGRAVSLVILRLQELDAFSIRQGTIARDEVVRLVGSSIKETTRRLNLSARYADDSFICILGGTDADGALVFMGRLQERLRAADSQLELPALNAGIAAYRPGMKSAAELVAHAEDALKRAEKEGAGRVRVHGRQGQTTELKIGGGEKPAAKPAMPEGRGAGRKALVVVEEPAVRALLARYLNDHGFKVAQVSNVVDGVQCLTIEYDLLVSDISLGEGIGAELVRAAKMRWPSIQVLGLAQLNNGRTSLDVLNAGVDRYIEKPLDLPRLRQHLSELLARHDRLVSSIVEARQLSLDFEAEKAEAASALRRNEEEYRSVVESLHEVLFRLDASGNFTFLNWAWTATTNYPVEDSLGQPLLGFVHPEDRTVLHGTLKGLRNGEHREIHREVRLLARDGAVRWVELRARPTLNGGVHGATGTLDDVTWRKQAEEQLRRSEAESRGLLSALPDAVFGLQRDGVLLSYEGPDLELAARVGEPLEQIFSTEVAERYRDCLAKLFSAREVQVLEYAQNTLDATKYYEARFARISDDEAVVVLRNVSDRKSLEYQLRQSQKLEAIGRLAGGLAHDFNNLLTVVQGNAHLLMDELASQPNAREYAQQIDDAAARGAELIRQLLAFGRKQVLQPRVVDLNTVVADVKPLLPSLVGEDIAVKLELDHHLGLVKADPAQIEHVLVNLAAYGKARMPHGGVLQITTRNGANGELDTAVLNVHDPASLVCLSVEDTGEPVDDETRANVFEPFFGDLTAPHSGLRLATVYGIVSQSGGTVVLDEAPSGGARFQIFLPRVDLS